MPTPKPPVVPVPVADVVVDNRLVTKEKLAAGMMALGRKPQITRDGRVEGVDYNVPLTTRTCKTPGCVNVRKLKGRKDNPGQRKVYFAYCQKCLLVRRGKKKRSTYQQKPIMELKHGKKG